MLRFAIATLIVFSNLVACSPDDELVPICPAECWTGPEDQRDVGSCRSGKSVCDEKGNILSCDGEVLSESEECDGEDNDCDGVVDESSYSVSEPIYFAPYDSRNDCEQAGKCAQTFQVCVGGTMVCDYTDGPPSAEICDNIDNDCNGRRDDGLNEEVVFCYTADDQSTAIHGECRPGFMQCADGRMVCVGEALPSPERCDEKDNDCNGLVDDVEDSAQQVDIVISIDTSGSMGGTIDSVASVACQYAQSSIANNPDFRFALELIATPNNDVSLVQNLGTAQELCDALSMVTIQGGSEPTLSANLWTVDLMNPMMIDWRPDSRRVFIGFGDEYAQAVECSNGDNICMASVLDDILEFCQESDTLVYWFAKEFDYYLEATAGCGGEFFFLSDSEDYMLDSLNSIFSGLCAI